MRSISVSLSISDKERASRISSVVALPTSRSTHCVIRGLQEAAESGVDLVTLAAMLGHSKINMVLRYAHPTEQHQAAAMQKIQQRMAAR